MIHNCRTRIRKCGWGHLKYLFDAIGGFPPTQKKGLLGVCGFIGNFNREDILYLYLLTVIITDMLKNRWYIMGTVL